MWKLALNMSLHAVYQSLSLGHLEQADKASTDTYTHAFPTRTTVEEALTLGYSPVWGIG